MAPKNPKDKEQIGRVGEAGLFSSLIEPCRGKGEPSATRSEASVRATGTDQVKQYQGQEVACRRRNSKRDRCEQPVLSAAR